MNPPSTSDYTLWSDDEGSRLYSEPLTASPVVFSVLCPGKLSLFYSFQIFIMIGLHLCTTSEEVFTWILVK